MLLAQADHKKYSDQYQATALRYNVEDMVQLNTKNQFTKGLCRKLENWRASLYAVKQIINAQVIELELLDKICVHPVFSVNFLEPTTIDLYPSHIQPLPPPIEFDNETEWKIEAIIDFCYFGRAKKLQYCVQQTSYSELNWENAANVLNVFDLLHNFHMWYPRKSSPTLHGLARAYTQEKNSITSVGYRCRAQSEHSSETFAMFYISMTQHDASAHL